LLSFKIAEERLLLLIIAASHIVWGHDTHQMVPFISQTLRNSVNLVLPVLDYPDYHNITGVYCFDQVEIFYNEKTRTAFKVVLIHLVSRLIQEQQIVEYEREKAELSLFSYRPQTSIAVLLYHREKV